MNEYEGYDIDVAVAKSGLEGSGVSSGDYEYRVLAKVRDAFPGAEVVVEVSDAVGDGVHILIPVDLYSASEMAGVMATVADILAKELEALVQSSK